MAKETETDIDPRFAARREEIASGRRRRNARVALGVAIVVTIGAIGWFVTRTPLLDVDTIDVSGNSVVTTDDIVAASNIHVGEPLLEVDPGASKHSIEALPWIDSATVDRSWGGTIAITVTERTEIAVALDGSGVRMLLDASGRVLGPDGPFDRTDLLIDGIEAGAAGTTVEGADAALEAITHMGPGVRSRVSSISVAPDGSITIRLTPQGTVRLGAPTRIAEKIAALTIVLGQVDQRDLATIDVANPDTPVVTRTPK